MAIINDKYNSIKAHLGSFRSAFETTYQDPRYFPALQESFNTFKASLPAGYAAQTASMQSAIDLTKGQLGQLVGYMNTIYNTYYPEFLPVIAAFEQEFADYKQAVLMKFGPLAFYEWEKQTYRGYPLDLTGYVETFRDDFTNQVTITGKTGAGPWYTAVHASEPSSRYYDLSEASELYQMTNGVLTLRLDKTAAGVWRAPLIQTMKADGTGFSQAKGAFEARIRFPLTAGYSGNTPGFWGGFWLLSAADFQPAITDHLIEIDHPEVYGGDRGLHTTVHVKPHRVPLPDEYPDRAWKPLYSDPQTVFNTVDGAHTYPATNTLANGQFHTCTVVIDDEWVTTYYDGFSVGRFSNAEGYFSTPLYMLLSSIRNPNVPEPSCVSPADMQVEYCRALKKGP